MEKTRIQKIIKDFLFYSVLFGGIVAGNVVYKKYTQKLEVADSARRATICPSLLSISRSARDTLIVMKAETLCNTFVLDSLK